MKNNDGNGNNYSNNNDSNDNYEIHVNTSTQRGSCSMLLQSYIQHNFFCITNFDGINLP